MSLSQSSGGQQSPEDKIQQASTYVCTGSTVPRAVSGKRAAPQARGVVILQQGSFLAF